MNPSRLPATPGAAEPSAIVVGSGPNGLAAAITLAEAGWRVQVLEAALEIGGGTRSAALTLPGFSHDVCAAVHPLAAGSPFFQAGPEIEWIEPPASVAHPFDDGSAALIERSFEGTGATLGPDAHAWRRLVAPWAAAWDEIAPDLLGPPPIPPRRPLLLARFGLAALWPAKALAQARFDGPRARALFAGLAAHAVLPLERAISAAAGLVLAALAHAHGWPLAAGGSGQIGAALAARLGALGGSIQTGHRVASVDELPPVRAVLLDLTPRQVLFVAGHRLPAGYRRALARYRYGPGTFKLDWALAGPIPWQAAGCRRAGTVHLGGSLEEIAAAERDVWRGRVAERPFVILAQPSLFDPARAPAGQHTGWAYCHVPPGWPAGTNRGANPDLAARIEAQVERFAPGFRRLILARHVMGPAELEAYNENYVGGDIGGGVLDLGQLYTRPAARCVPYSTPRRGLWLCSSSTPPGGGVHGMCGYHAARAILRHTGR